MEGEILEILANSYSEYVDYLDDCSLLLSLELADGSQAPDVYFIDSTTGLITFFNKADETVDDELIVVIRTT